MTKNAFIEMVKEGLRIALFAGIAALIGWITTQISTLDPNSTYYIIATVVLRLADKWVHENKNIEAKVISWF